MSVRDTHLTPPLSPDRRVGPAVLWSFTALGFLAVLLDGFDTVALAFSLPTSASRSS